MHGGVTIVDAPPALRILETSQPPAYYVAPEFVDHEPPGRDRSVARCASGRASAEYADIVVGDIGVPGGRVGPTATRTPAFPNDPRSLGVLRAEALDECWIDDERVDGNEGSFYGGWVTANVTGPFKGAPGTRFW